MVREFETFEEYWSHWSSLYLSEEGSESLFESIAEKAWQAAQPQWQSIESPPNDRRPVLVCNSFATWESCYSASSGDWLPAHLTRTGKGVPTHWMELPPPPLQQ